ncbi:MAG: hypothetical protein LBL13_14180, partial [Bacteroidales bacterium]|nr:hypothetical protein [Bacteroidales bacterium]
QFTMQTPQPLHSSTSTSIAPLTAIISFYSNFLTSLNTYFAAAKVTYIYYINRILFEQSDKTLTFCKKQTDTAA